VVINPYRIIHEYFNNEEMLRIKNKILEGHTQTEKPHIYLIAGGAYTSMIEQQKKQAIVISGESGAGKT
jgi:myosin heavy subunit